MPGDKIISNPGEGGDVRNTDGDKNDDKPVSSGFGGDVSSTTGPETPHFPDNGAGPAPEPGNGQSKISPTGKEATEENAAGCTKQNTDNLPLQKDRQEDAHAGLDRMTASQSENYSAWYPPGCASSLQSALTDDITASFPQPGAGREDFGSHEHPGNSGIVSDAEIISPLSLNHSPGAGARRTLGLRGGGGGSRPSSEETSPEDPAFGFGRRNAGLTGFPAPEANAGELEGPGGLLPGVVGGEKSPLRWKPRTAQHSGRRDGGREMRKNQAAREAGKETDTN
ncbi:hypothetical protein CTA2_4926 [Colletotrichum tanaceti]|nr:hypothetical protein CTA2_4926 [Colletotrichum tanaceti]